MRNAVTRLESNIYISDENNYTPVINVVCCSPVNAVRTLHLYFKKVYVGSLNNLFTKFSSPLKISYHKYQKKLKYIFEISLGIYSQQKHSDNHIIETHVKNIYDCMQI